VGLFVVIGTRFACGVGRTFETGGFETGGLEPSALELSEKSPKNSSATASDDIASTGLRPKEFPFLG
jgi:hypothetical protein